MDGSVRIEGLDEAMRALQAAFPSDRKQQRATLNQAMSASAKKTMVPMAKAIAMNGDGSGALSEAIGVRNASAKKARQRGTAGFVQVLPVRSNMKAMAMYIAHYYTSRGKIAPATMMASGIRHGHLVEFGSVHNTPRSFMWASAISQTGAYRSIFSAMLKQKIESAVQRAARKRAKK